jgi:hypothetical protein
MSRDNDRRAIAWFLLLLLALIAMRGENTFTLAPIAALVARVVVFYFPRKNKSAAGQGWQPFWRSRRSASPSA